MTYRMLTSGRRQLAKDLTEPAELRLTTKMPPLTDPWTLGGIKIANRVVLAPLAGIGNWFVRLQAKRFGAGLVVSEMVSSFGLAHGNERTVREFLRIHPDEHPVSMQLFGHDPDVMREAAAMVADAGAELIDLNMGCPVRKVVRPARVRRCSRTRTGRWRWPARRMRAAGFRSRSSCAPASSQATARAWLWPGGWPTRRAWPASPSTRATPRSSTRGAPDYGLARELVESLDVPVILSGGLSSDAEALRAFEESGAAAVMLARGSLGDPWRFGRLLGTYTGEPSPARWPQELEWVIDCAEEHLGVERAGRYLRKFYPWYAERLGLTRREREPLVTAPTTAAAREVWGRIAGAETPLAA